MKNPVRLALAAATVAALALAGCSSGSSESGESGTASGETLDVYLSMTTGSAQYAEMQELISKFEEETGNKIELTIDSDNYENNMKVRMASGNLPDIWSTHGWSVMRYSSFLEPLDDQSWEQYVAPGLDESMRDANGSIYALPIEYTVTGILTNFDVLDEVGVDPDDIETWDDFSDVLAKVTAAGKSGIASSGKDNSSAGNLANEIAANAFTDDQLSAFTNGTFDSDAYQSGVLDMIDEWADAGYFNADYVSASFDDTGKALAQGDAAFAFAQPSLLTTALTFNADANIGFIPFPSNGTNGEYLVGGEGVNAYGVWKDSEKKETALEFLDFLADPENAKPLVESIGTYSGLTNVEVDLGTIQSSYDKWVKPGELPTKPFFDRVYLPSGMWSTMVSSTDAVISRQSTPADATKQMSDQFATLFGQHG